VDVSLTAKGRKEATRLNRKTASLVEQLILKIPERKRTQVQEALALLWQALEGVRCC
jgi:DNA-binding MarR family transcriptional regulator